MSGKVHASAIVAALLCAALAGCAAQEQVDPQAINDPFEAGNRRVHAFNKGLDAQVIRPLTSGFDGGDDSGEAEGGPSAVDGGLALLANLGGNLSLPGKVVNHVLQGRPEPAIKNTLRFALNSTIGVGGIFDPAGRYLDLNEIDTDFGETLYVWGMPEGPYLELPVLGPSTSRRAVGRVVDMVIDPMDNWLNRDEARAATAVRVISKAGERARFGDTVDSVLHESADSYAQARLVYLMHRRHELTKGRAADDPYIIDPYETETAGVAAEDDFVIDPYADQ